MKSGDKWRLKVPVVGGIVNRAQLSRFSRTFSLMIRAGVPLNQAIQMAAEALGNRFLENRLIEMKNGIEGGNTITSTASQSGVFTPLVLQMIAVGEETGQVDNLLLEVSDFYDREVDYDLKTLTARIEPLLLLIVAIMVLLLALGGIFLPMWGVCSMWLEAFNQQQKNVSNILFGFVVFLLLSPACWCKGSKSRKKPSTLSSMF